MHRPDKTHETTAPGQIPLGGQEWSHQSCPHGGCPTTTSSAASGDEELELLGVGKACEGSLRTIHLPKAVEDAIWCGQLFCA
jgi:hypothetical protein